jgi:predicted Ser/Thr protein kinase
MTITLDLSPEQEEKLRTLATARGQDPNRYAAAALVAQLDRDAQQWERARAEAQAILNGPFHLFDPAADRRRIKEKYGIELEDLSHLSREELADRADASLAVLPPEVIAEAKREGLL